MMKFEEMKTQVTGVKEKMFGGEVTMARKDLVTLVTICVMAGMIAGLCKGLTICAGKKEKGCKCNSEDVCQCE